MFYRKDNKTYCIQNINGGNYRSNALTAEEIKIWYNAGGDKGFKCNLFLTIKEYQEYEELTGVEEIELFRDLGLVK